MAAVIDALDRDLKQEWDKHKNDLWAIFKDIGERSEELDVTVELDAGIMKLTIEAQFNRPTPNAPVGPS
jgi:hypothetical protein